MSDSKENEETREPLPSFFVRWLIFFRLYPGSFLQPRFLFDVLFMSWRHPIYWNNVMAAEKRRLQRKREADESGNLDL